MRLCSYCRSDVIFKAECDLYLQPGEMRAGECRPLASMVQVRVDTAKGYDVMTSCADPLCARPIGVTHYASDGVPILYLSQRGDDSNG